MLSGSGLPNINADGPSRKGCVDMNNTMVRVDYVWLCAGEDPIEGVGRAWWDGAEVLWIDYSTDGSAPLHMLFLSPSMHVFPLAGY
jgi:hypothetical protein